MARLDPVLRFLYEGIVADANAEGTRLVPYSTQVIRDDENGCVDVYATTDYVYQTEDGRRLDPPEVERARTMLAKDREQALPVQKKNPAGAKMQPETRAAVEAARDLVEQGHSKNRAAEAASLIHSVAYNTIRDHLKDKE